MVENEVSSETQWNAAKNYKNYDMKCLWEMIVKHKNYEKNPHQLKKKTRICYSCSRETPAWN